MIFDVTAEQLRHDNRFDISAYPSLLVQFLNPVIATALFKAGSLINYPPTAARRYRSHRPRHSGRR